MGEYYRDLLRYFIQTLDYMTNKKPLTDEELIAITKTDLLEAIITRRYGDIPDPYFYYTAGSVTEGFANYLLDSGTYADQINELLTKFETFIGLRGKRREEQKLECD